MINVPLKDIILKISTHTGMSEEDVKKKIAEKVDHLYGLVSEEGAAHIIANENGIKIFEVVGDLKIKDILMGMKAVDVVGKVVRKYELREFSTDKRKGKVANLMMADETASIRVVFWNDKTDDFTNITEGDIIKVKSAYVRENSGRKELHMGDNSHVIINPANVKVETRERKEYDKKHLSELQEGMSAEILGTIVQVFDIRFFEVCPKCNKRLRLKEDTFHCDEHGLQSPQYNYVMNVYLDDGTGNVRVNFWKQQTQRLLKLSDEEMQHIRTNSELFEKYKTDLLGEQIKVLGNVKNNITGRLEFTADIIFTGLNPDQEIEMLDHAKQVVLDTDTSTAASSATPKTVSSSTPSKPVPKKSGSSDDEFEIGEEFLDE